MGRFYCFECDWCGNEKRLFADPDSQTNIWPLPHTWIEQPAPKRPNLAVHICGVCVAARDQAIEAVKEQRKGKGKTQ